METKNGEAEKWPEYRDLARKILDAVQAKTRESGKWLFADPVGYSFAGILGDSRVKSNIQTYTDTNKRWAIVVVEGRMGADLGAKSLTTHITTHIDESPGSFPFVQTAVGTGDLIRNIIDERTEKGIILQSMSRFLKSVEEWTR